MLSVNLSERRKAVRLNGWRVTFAGTGVNLANDTATSFL